MKSTTRGRRHDAGAEEAAAAQAAAPGTGRGARLPSGAVPFWGLVSQSIAGMAPATDVVAFMTAGAAFALVTLPLAYFAAFVLMFIEVNTIYHLSRHRSSAGGYYSYVSAGLGARPAVVSALMVVFYQTMSVAGVAVYIGGVFLPALARSYLGIDVPSWLWAVLTALFVGVPWLLGVLGIRPTVRVLAVTSGIEILFLLVASVAVIALAAPVHAPLRPFDLGAVGVKGVALGMIFAVTSFIGVGSHAPLAEESVGATSGDGRAIGKAAILSLVLVGVTLTVSAYALTVGWGEARMATFATATAPGVVVFLRYLGPLGAVLLVVFAVNSALMDNVALVTSSARVLYAVGRDRLVRHSLAVLNDRHAPARAVTALAGAAAAAALGFGFWLGPASAFDVITTGVLFGLVTTHTLMNFSLMRLSSGERRLIQVLFHVVLPVVAMGLFWLVLYESVVPISFPLAWGGITWAAILVASMLWTWRVTAHTGLSGAAGRTLGTHPDDHHPQGDAPRT
ncbi:MAG: APC family permease [Actinomycetota bacterium]|nr:APC family permease [Actinomycetota bacterium]